MSCIQGTLKMRRGEVFLLLQLLSPLIVVQGRRQSDAARVQFDARSTADPCYDDQRSDGDAQRCLPDFVNAAFGRQVVASSTCGRPRASRYCMTTRDRDGRVGRDCHVCDETEARLRHPPTYLTDLNNPNNVTCWISQPLASRLDNVTLTLSLGKKFEVCHSLTMVT